MRLYNKKSLMRWLCVRYMGAVGGFLMLFFSGCAGCPSFPAEAPFRPSAAGICWRSLCPGVDAADIYDPQLPLIAHAVKIDLRNPSLSVVVSESDLFKNTKGSIRGETTRSFALRHNTVVAFNAAAFETCSLFFSVYRTIVGIHITDFRRMSMPNERYGALLFYADRTARIVDSQTEVSFSADVRHALSGFWTILRNGIVLPQNVSSRDSRTAAGIADNGETLFIVAVEGENKRKSCGLSFEETAVLMRWLGASDAFQLDGGSSSTLVLRENGVQRAVAPSIGGRFPIRVASNAGIICIE